MVNTLLGIEGVLLLILAVGWRLAGFPPVTPEDIPCTLVELAVMRRPEMATALRDLIPSNATRGAFPHGLGGL